MSHIHEKIDFTVEVFIVFENKVLLRKHDKYNIWLGVGGHIELDEDPNQAAIREVKEEVGLDVSLFGGVMNFGLPQGGRELVPPKFLNRHHINDTHEHIALVYFAESSSTNIVQGETEKSEDMNWFTNEELDDPRYEIMDHIKQYARTALAEMKR